MPPVFNRFVPDPHPYDDALKDWLGTGGTYGVESPAMARNFQWDDRVSKEREAQFDLGISSRPVGGAHLKTTLTNYFRTKVRHSRRPAFLDKDTNGTNIVHGGPDNIDAFDHGRALVNVLDLHKLGGQYEYAKQAGWVGFDDYDNSFNDDQLLAWLNARLEGKPDAEQRAFVTRVLARLNKSRRRVKTKPSRAKPFEPAWVTFWDDFEPFLNEGPDRWCEVLGVPKTRSRVWVVVLKYTVSNACTLVRPTQLDAEWYGHHFPSPPNLSPKDGGRAMDLRISSPPGRDPALLVEFIHPQIYFKPRYIQRIGCTTRATFGSGHGPLLAERRKQHRQLLVTRCNAPVANWMPHVV